MGLTWSTPLSFYPQFLYNFLYENIMHPGKLQRQIDMPDKLPPDQKLWINFIWNNIPDFTRLQFLNLKFKLMIMKDDTVEYQTKCSYVISTYNFNDNRRVAAILYKLLHGNFALEYNSAMIEYTIIITFDPDNDEEKSLYDPENPQIKFILTPQSRRLQIHIAELKAQIKDLQEQYCTLETRLSSES